MADRLYARPVDDRNDKIAFFSALAIGLVGIVAARFVIPAFIEQTGLGWTDYIALAIALGVIFLYS